MKKLLIASIVMISTIVVVFTTSCTASDIINFVVYRGEGSSAWEAEEAMLESSIEIEQASTENEEAVEKDSEESDSSLSNQSGTLTFDNSNSELGCFVQANMTIEHKDNKDRELESVMILTASSSQMATNPTIFDITFNFDQGSITGSFSGIYYRPEEGDAFDATDIVANISNGTVTWDAGQQVWLFEGDVKMEVDLEIKNKIGSDGDKIIYGDANIVSDVIGKIAGASGAHKAKDHHGDLKDYGAYFNILYEGDFPPATGNGELRFLSIECWLEMPSGEDMASKFPPGP